MASQEADDDAARYPSERPAGLIAIDLDGTLLGAGGELSERTAAAVRSAGRAGYRVVLATGRPPHLVTDLADRIGGAVTHVVATNGSVISTFPHDGEGSAELLHLLSFRIDQARSIIESLRRHDDGYGFAFATDAGFAHEAGFAQRMPAAVTDPDVDDVLALGGTQAFKLFAFHERHTAHELIDLLPPLVDAALTAAELATEPFAVSHMGADAVEIGPATTDKAAGLRWLCDHLGVDRVEVVAFGDEWNDLTMLDWAGCGIAMANADERVRAIADEIAPDHTDDGVGQIIERLVASSETA